MPRTYTHSSPAEHQRRPEHERDDAWIRAFLHRTEIAHLGHERAGQPFVTPVNF